MEFTTPGPVVWRPEYQEAFDSLKRALTTVPVLGFADFKQNNFILVTDANHQELEALLLQDGKTQVIVYASLGLWGT